MNRLAKPLDSILLVLLTLGLLGSSSCAPVVEAMLQTAADEVAGEGDSFRPAAGATLDPNGMMVGRERGARQPTSIYRVATLPGRTLVPTPLNWSGHTRRQGNDFFRSPCPALFNISFESVVDPFGRIDRPMPGAFAIGTQLRILLEYPSFGRVELGRAGPQHYQWLPRTVFSRAAARCGFPGLRLLSIGDEGVHTLHR